jgi:4-hydroxybenzoate polyprenyltransferase
MKEEGGTRQDEGESEHSPLRTYLELFRLPNVFTAMADVFMGYLFTHPDLANWPVFVLLLASSSGLYTAGMVLNDVFDFDVDARDRPQRPLPSGRIALVRAGRLGMALLVAGVAAGWLAAALASQRWPGLIATLLALAVLAYDGGLKRTPAAPLVMGGCRFLNVLLGMSAMPGGWHAVHWLAASGIGLYIAGVTWFARTEARASSRWQLGLATLVIASGLVVLAAFPSQADAELAEVSWPRNAASPAADVLPGNGGGEPVVEQRWYLFWCVLGALIAWRCLRAVAQPEPLHVQAAVKHCILSLIVLDAAVCWAVRGGYWAVVILLLLAPAMLLGRWIYST